MERAVALRSASFCERGVLMRTRRFITLAAIAGIMSAGLLRAADSNNYTATILVSNEPGEAPVFLSLIHI